MEESARLRKCPFCKTRVSMSQSERGYFKISHMCSFGHIYISVVSDEIDDLVDAWNGTLTSKEDIDV